MNRAANNIGDIFNCCVARSHARIDVSRLSMSKNVLSKLNEMIDKPEYNITRHTSETYWREYVSEVCRLIGRDIPNYLK